MRRLCVILFALLTFCLGVAQQQSSLTRQMGITQKLGDQVPKDVKFKDESGKVVQLGDMFRGRPVVLVPIFYRCQSGCSLLVEQMFQTIAKANKSGDKLVIGRDFDLVMLSIHPLETPDLAFAKKQFFMKTIEPPDATPQWRETTSNGWHLLTGDLESIHKVTQAIGLKYSYDAEKDLINHPTLTVTLTPAGRISGYTIGNDYPTRVAEEEVGLAAKEQLAEPADQSMMFGCIMIDPATGKVRVVVENLVRLGAVLTLLILGFSIVSMTLKSKRDEALRLAGPTPDLPIGRGTAPIGSTKPNRSPKGAQR